MKQYSVIAHLVNYLIEVSYILPSAQYIGTGAFILTFYLDRTNEKKEYINLFVLFTIIFSFFEYLVGFALDALFSARWWDYSDNKYNLNGRITILNSFLWGVITIAFTKYIYPLIKKFRNVLKRHIPDSIQIITASFIVTCIFIDFILSCIKYLK